MIRTASISVVALLGLLWGAVPASAQVFVRAPFVQVETGPPGVYVRAPFVRLWIPNGPPPAYLVPPGPRVQVYVPPPVTVFPANPAPIQQGQALPAPQQQAPAQSDAVPPPPQPLQSNYPTLEQFARSFQPKAGHFDVTIIHPVTRQPVQVRFSLPEGSPRRVIVNQDEIEFRYNLRTFVRLDFSGDGVVVTSR